jgi:arylsulfatase A-like enzyme
MAAQSSRSGTSCASGANSFTTTAMSVTFLLLSVVCGTASALTDKPNILMIPIDDLNNWVGYFNEHTPKGNQQSLTPNLDRLSAMGMSFTNAHASATICNPSRAAVWSGVRAGISGCYDNKDYPWKPFINERMGLNYWLQQGGYHTAARGKTYHSSQQGETNAVKIYVDEWDDYPKVHAGDVVGEYTDRMGFTHDIELSREVYDDDDPDWHTVNFCADKLHEDPSKRDNKPLFLACGIVKPHLPWVVPQKYYDRFPPDEVNLPPYATTNNWKEWEERVWEDLKDVPEYAINKIANPDKEFTEVIELGKWETSIQSYLAAIAYMDMNIGRLIDAFEKSPEKDNTIIVLWSDHGYHLGEKGHHKKQTLWEEASDVPYIWVVPGMTEPGSICNKPVDLQSMYPTLMKLVGLDVPDHVDGDDIRPLLEDANADWDGVATVTVRYKNHAIVSYSNVFGTVVGLGS